MNISINDIHLFFNQGVAQMVRAGGGMIISGNWHDCRTEFLFHVLQLFHQKILLRMVCMMWVFTTTP